jgi:hypothetical protein
MIGQPAGDRDNHPVEKLGNLVRDWFEISVVVISLGVGVGAALIAMETASARISAGFYNTIAQILPVFLVALAVEQKLVDRLGLTEDEYAERANQSMTIAVGASIEYEGENYPRARELQESFDSQPEFAWVAPYIDDFLYLDDPEQQADISAMARKRYRRQRSNEATFVAAAVGLLIVGEGAALGGMLQSGSTRCAPYLALSVGSTVAVVLALTLNGAKELVSSLRG